MSSENIKSIVFVMYGHDPMQRRWSMDYLSSALMSLGIDTKIVDSAAGDIETVCETADVVVVYKCFQPDVIKLMRRLKNKGVFVVFYCDDYLFQPGCKYTNGGLTMEPLEVADALMSPSSFLLSKMPFAKPKILRKNVLDAIGMEMLRQDYRRNPGLFSMGFTMVPSRGKEMEGFMDEILKELNIGVRTGELLVCHYFGRRPFKKYNRIQVIEHSAFERRDWQGFYNKLVSLDLGVIANPMEENDYWSSKSELKFVESGAMGVPLVTVRVPPYTEFLKEGENGFFASTPKEFADKILLLMRNEKLSRMVSANAYKNVVDNYDVTKNAVKFFEDLVEAKRQVSNGISFSMKPSIDLLGQKVCMVMGYTPSNPKFDEMGKFVSEVNMKYCFKHGYGFRLYTSGFAVDRHPSWSKLLFIQDALKSYSWVMWVDTDAIVTNSEIELEKFLDDNFMLVVGKQDWNKEPWNSINFGIFFIRNDPLVNEFIDKVWADIARKDRVGWEQDGVRQVIKNEPFRSKVKVVYRRDFNSLVSHKSLKLDNTIDLETESWHKGDFIAHYGGKRDDIVEAMKAKLAGHDDLEVSTPKMVNKVINRQNVLKNLMKDNGQVIGPIYLNSFVEQSILIPQRCVLSSIGVKGATYTKVIRVGALVDIMMCGKSIRRVNLSWRNMGDNQWWRFQFDPVTIGGSSVLTVRIVNRDANSITFYQCLQENIAKTRLGVKQSHPIAMELGVINL